MLLQLNEKQKKKNLIFNEIEPKTFKFYILYFSCNTLKNIRIKMGHNKLWIQ